MSLPECESSRTSVSESSFVFFRPSPRFFFGWWVVAASALGLTVSYGPIVLATFGVFSLPLHREFRWNRAELSAAVSLATLLVALAQPLCGRLVDRWGARRVVLWSLLSFGSTLLALSALRGHLAEIYLGYALLGLFGAGTTPVPYSRVISRWFERRRGVALGLSLAGFGVGMLVMPVLTSVLITHMGWRGAYRALGVLIVGGVVPMVWALFKEDPEAMGMLPDGRGGVDDFQNMGRGRREPVAGGMSWSEVRRTLTFWKIAVAFFLVSTGVHACMVHFVPLLTDRGLSPERAAKAAALFGVAILFGRLAVGPLLDRFFAPYVIAALFGGVIGGLVFLWLGTPPSFPFLAAFFLGLGLGMDTLAYVITRYFGIRSFGEIYGYAFAGVLFGASAGPVLLGLVFHRIGSYAPGLMALILAVSVAIGLIVSLKPYPMQS